MTGQHDELAVSERHIDQPDQPEPAAPRPASWTDFSADKLQKKRPIAPSSIQSQRARCQAHNNQLKNATTRWGKGQGTVARCTYHECDCVEYRPVKAKNYQSGGNWIIERGK